MLIRSHDAALSDEEWKHFLLEHDFGQLIAPGNRRTVPVIVPVHFVYEWEGTILFHLARANPVWEALAENPTAVMSVVGAYTYVPTYWNAGEGRPEEHGIPTSYYGAVQATGSCEVVDEPEEIAAILQTQLAHFQPEGCYATVTPHDLPYGPSLKAIRGVRLSIESIQAKFKFGGNKTVNHRLLIAEQLRERGRARDLEARRYLLARLPVTDGS
jgi:transcriptional regulator